MRIPMTPIKVTFRDGTTKTFPSINETSRVLNVDKRKISDIIKGIGLYRYKALIEE